MNYRDRCAKCGAERVDSQLGLEPTPTAYVASLVSVFSEVWRVLRDDGTVWLNLGDSYIGSWGNYGGQNRGNGRQRERSSERMERPAYEAVDHGYKARPPTTDVPGLKPKDLAGIPWRVAFALQEFGWYLRSDVIWAKPNPMPESVTDRPTRSHEYVFLLSKSPRYFYDAEAIRESDAGGASGNGFVGRQGGADKFPMDGGEGTPETWEPGGGRNRRSVWTVTTQPFPGAHFATFPPKLIEPCILAGSPPKCCGECGAPWEREVKIERQLEEGRNELGLGYKTTEIGPVPGVTTLHHDISRETLGWGPTCEHDDDSGHATILDPFAGSGTTGLVSLRHGRSFVGIELNPEYAEMARNRIRDDAPLFNVGAET